MLKDIKRQHYKYIIHENLEKSATVRFKDHPAQIQERINEVEDALAIGCMLARPRRFGIKEMSADDFQRIANKFDETICAVVVEALYKNGAKIKNRVFYILGVLARF